MAEYVEDSPKTIEPGEPIMFYNRCKSPVEIGAGLVFREDGDYIVSVREGKITVRENGGTKLKIHETIEEFIRKHDIDDPADYMWLTLFGMLFSRFQECAEQKDVTKEPKNEG